MPEIIYTDTRPDQHRIHVEIDEGDIADLLDDLRPLDHDVFGATKDFIALLEDTQAKFRALHLAEAHEAEISRT